MTLLLALTLASASDVDLQQHVRLLDAAGAPVEGTHTVRVAVLPDADPAPPEVTCDSVTLSDVVFRDGYATLALDDVRSQCFAGPAWLAVSIGSPLVELLPRHAVAAVPVAGVAHQVRVTGAPSSSTCSDAGDLVFDTSTSALRVCNGTTWQGVGSSNTSGLGSSSNPAASCQAIKTANSSAANDVYWLDPDGPGVGVSPFQNYCRMDIDLGGWTFVASFSSTDSNAWTYYNARWTDGTVLNEANTNPYTGGSIDRKTLAFSTVPVAEMLITDATATNYHVMHRFLGSAGNTYTSARAAFAAQTYLWAERRTSAGTGMWSSTNWALNNVEPGNDRCWDYRINICKQTYVGHTGGGGLVGSACEGGASNNHDLAIQTFTDGLTYRCLTSGSEPKDLPIATNTYYLVFVRQAAP